MTAIIVISIFLGAIFFLNVQNTGRGENKMHQPGIEPGSHRWQRCILPLNH